MNASEYKNLKENFKTMYALREHLLWFYESYSVRDFDPGINEMMSELLESCNHMINFTNSQVKIGLEMHPELFTNSSTN